MKFLFQYLFFLTILTSCNQHHLEKNYELDYNPNEEIWLVVKDNGYSNVKIPGHILFYGHNNNFIIACQKPSDSIYNFKENLIFDKMMDNSFEQMQTLVMSPGAGKTLLTGFFLKP